MRVENGDSFTQQIFSFVKINNEEKEMHSKSEFSLESFNPP